MVNRCLREQDQALAAAWADDQEKQRLAKAAAVATAEEAAMRLCPYRDRMQKSREYRDDVLAARAALRQRAKASLWYAPPASKGVTSGFTNRPDALVATMPPKLGRALSNPEAFCHSNRTS